MHNATLTAKYCHYRRILGNIEGCEGPPNSVFSSETMTNSRFIAGFVISRSSVRIRLPAPAISLGVNHFSPIERHALLSFAAAHNPERDHRLDPTKPRKSGFDLAGDRLCDAMPMKACGKARTLFRRSS